MSQQQNLPIPEEVKAYYQIKSSTVQEMKDLLGSIKGTKEQDLQARVRELEEELRHLRNSKKYGLVWDSEKEPEQVVVDCQKKLPILEEIKEKKILSDDSDDSHILIEGDNYHALQVLSYTHKESIDVIYIDPPYNTGSKDFIYNDKIVDIEDTYRHSKWLNFMEKRLRLAYDLLKEEGLIFISIDDNEQAQLKLLCDEIFGDNNFIATIVWKKKRGKDNSAKFFSKTHEYLLCYGRDTYYSSISKVTLDEETRKAYKNKDNDIRGDYRVLGLWARGSQGGSRYSYTFKNGLFIEDQLWLVNKASMKRLEDEERLIFVGNKVYRKLFISENNGAIPETLWLEHSNAANAADEIKDIFGSQNFETVKPLDYIKYIFKVSLNSNGTVLDFFAGSGTTGHAVMDLNKEDGGNRNFIICTNNENNICEEVTYERVKRVSQGYTNAKGKTIEGLGGNLRYYKTNFVEVENLQEITDEKKLELTYNAGELLAIKEGIYNERIKTEYGQVFENSRDIVAVYFKESTRDLTKMAQDLVQIQQEKGGKVIWYIYGNAFQEDSFPMIAKLELKDIPDPILKVYREINKV